MAGSRRKAEHPAERYIREVLAGTVVVGRLVRLAVERHVRDLDDGHKRGLRFDEDAARHAIDFYGFLRHSKGEWAGEPFELSPWQAFITWSLFGWMRKNGTRRFREAYEEVARKNGKSTKIAGTGLYGLVADGEPGAEIYSSATKREQARISHSEAVRMVKASPDLSGLVKPFRDNLNIPGTASKFEPLGADADTLDGLNIHMALVDELHAHKNRDMVDVLETATGSRRQPLIYYITTAGYDRTSICREIHDRAVQVLEGHVPDDSLFAYIATLDDDDDWTDESVWVKANPNIGVSAKWAKLRAGAEKAKESLGYRNTFLRLHMNQWTQQSTKWIDMDAWTESGQTPVAAEDVSGMPCFGGLDLSTTTDISAWVMDFPLEDGNHVWLCRFWAPEERAAQRQKKDQVPYLQWAKEGYIELTPGDVIDYDVIRERINEDGKRFNIREIAIDRWNATQISTQLDGDGFTVVPFGQGFASMSAPSKEFEALVIGRRLRHGNNPVLNWMADNVAVKQDAAGNVKPDKEKSNERIDGIVAGIMATGRALVNDSGMSVYARRGVLVV